MTPIVISSILVFFVSLIEAIGLTLLKSTWKYAIPFTALNYGLVVVPLLALSLKYEGVGIVNFLFNIFSTIIVFLIGIYYFKEKINNLQLTGVIMSLFGIGVVLMGSEC